MMIPEIECFSDSYYILNLYAEQAEGRNIKNAQINNSLYKFIEENISNDSVVMSNEANVSTGIYVDPDGDVPIDTIKLPLKYIEKNGIENPPALDYFFIHTTDDYDRMRVSDGETI